jgi:hypothetical protein
MNRRVRITPGAGKPVDIDVEEALSQHGTVEQAVRRLLERSDEPELAHLLNSDRLGFDLFTERDGEATEAPLDGTEDWASLIGEVVQNEQDLVEIGLSRVHTGGRTTRRPAGSCNREAQR